MHEWKLWAPFASSVDVSVAGERLEMHQLPHGSWCAFSDNVDPGTRYGYILNGAGQPLPDPRLPGSRMAFTGFPASSITAASGGAIPHGRHGL